MLAERYIPREELEKLTPTQLQVLELLLEQHYVHKRNWLDITPSEIAHKLGISVKTARVYKSIAMKLIRKHIHAKRVKNLELNDLQPWQAYLYDKWFRNKLQWFSVWFVNPDDWKVWGFKVWHGKPTRYPSTCNIGVPLNCLVRLTKSGNWVLDPMAGAGTTGLAAAIVSHILGTRYTLMIDINKKAKHEYLKLRSQIAHLYPEVYEQHYIVGDCEYVLQSLTRPRKFHFIFWHPPYFGYGTMTRYREFTFAGDKLSTETSWERYLKWFEHYLDLFLDRLESKRYIAILWGDLHWYIKKALHADIHKLLQEKGLEFWHEVIICYARNWDEFITYTRTYRGKLGGTTGKITVIKYRSIAYNFILTVHEYLLIYRKS